MLTGLFHSLQTKHCCGITTWSPWCFSFEKGDIFIVNNEMGDGWLWMCNTRTGEEGQVYEELVEDLVSLLPFSCLR